MVKYIFFLHPSGLSLTCVHPTSQTTGLNSGWRGWVTAVHLQLPHLVHQARAYKVS